MRQNLGLKLVRAWVNRRWRYTGVAFKDLDGASLLDASGIKRSLEAFFLQS